MSSRRLSVLWQSLMSLRALKGRVRGGGLGIIVFWPWDSTYTGESVDVHMLRGHGYWCMGFTQLHAAGLVQRNSTVTAIALAVHVVMHVLARQQIHTTAAPAVRRERMCTFSFNHLRRSLYPCVSLADRLCCCIFTDPSGIQPVSHDRRTVYCTKQN